MSVSDLISRFYGNIMKSRIEEQFEDIVEKNILELVILVYIIFFY